MFVSSSHTLESRYRGQSHTLESRYRGQRGNYVILDHANVFIVEDNILWHLGGPSDQTVSHKTLS